MAIVEIMFATGIRVGELVSLRLRDWSEEDSAFIVMGKGCRQRLAVMPDERSKRALKEYLIRRQALNLGHDSLFPNSSGKKLSTQGVARVLLVLGTTAALETKVTPHMIRHTTATLLLRCGADIRIVQEVLGHASIVTTQRYTHVSKDDLLSTLRLRHPNDHMEIDSGSRATKSQLSLPFEREAR